MARGGHLGFEVFIQNTAPLNPAPGDFWFDTSGGTVLNFRTGFGSWMAVAIPTAALDTLSNAVSVLSASNAAISLHAISATSAIQAMSANLTSVTSALGSLSLHAASATSAILALSANQTSVTSLLNVLSAHMASATSAILALSATQTSAASAIQAMSANLTSVTSALGFLSQAVSVISAGLGGVQMRWVATAIGISSTAAAGAAISGLSVSVATGGTYQIDGRLLIQMSALDAFGISFTFPAMVSSGCAGIVRGAAGLTGGGGLGQSMSVITGAFDEGGSNSIVLSLIMSTLSSTLIDIQWLTQVSTAGTIQANARVSATTKPVNIQAGSFLRAHRII